MNGAEFDLRSQVKTYLKDSVQIVHVGVWTGERLMEYIDLVKEVGGTVVACDSFSVDRDYPFNEWDAGHHAKMANKQEFLNRTAGYESIILLLDKYNPIDCIDEQSADIIIIDNDLTAELFWQKLKDDGIIILKNNDVISKLDNTVSIANDTAKDIEEIKGEDDADEVRN